MIGCTIKKFKISNISAIFILLAADLGIGYFTLPYVFNISNFWCKKISKLINIAILMLSMNCIFGLFSCYLLI